MVDSAWAGLRGRNCGGRRAQEPAGPTALVKQAPKEESGGSGAQSEARDPTSRQGQRPVGGTLTEAPLGSSSLCVHRPRPRCPAPGLGLQPLSFTHQPHRLLHRPGLPWLLPVAHLGCSPKAQTTALRILIVRVWVDLGMNRFSWRLSKAGLGTLSRAFLFLGQSSPLLQPGQCCAPIAEDLESHVHECLCPSGLGLALVRLSL